MGNLVQRLKEHLESLTPEEIEAAREFFKDKRPKGWLSIEEHLPQMYAKDIMQGYSVFKVRYADGHEDESYISDHTVWYYSEAKPNGITHWFNE